MGAEMFRYGISAALEELPESQPVTLRGSIEELCQIAKETGYDALELHVRDPKHYDAGMIRATADRYGLSICATANGMEHTIGGLSLIDDDPEKQDQAVARVFEHVDFASTLGASLIVGIMRGNIPKGKPPAPYIERFSKALSLICDYAAAKQTPVVLESILRYINNYLNSAPETMEFITSLGHKNLSLHIDTHSMALEEKNLKESILYCKNKPLGYVHYSDNNRLYPGGGAIDFKALTHALMDIGYDDYITIECLPYPNPQESAARGLSYLKGIVSAVTVERQK
ncbi:MAG: sugar phosphate isomerase/epimerase [Treponema sp.]|nr:sugar phosphate isomerase/epimerase [Treponema sp.]